METGHLCLGGIITPFIPIDARSHLTLTYPRSCTPHNSPNQLIELDHLWRPSAQLVQSSDSLFRSSNAQKNYGIGSNWSVRYPPHLYTLRALIIILHLCSQVASEKAELLAASIEYEKDINLLESLYNDNKELLDQHKLDTDLKELEGYAWSGFHLPPGLTMAQNPIRPR